MPKINATLPTITQANVKDSLQWITSVMMKKVQGKKTSAAVLQRWKRIREGSGPWDSVLLKGSIIFHSVSLKSSRYVSGTGTLMNPVKQVTKAPDGTEAALCPGPIFTLSPARTSSSWPRASFCLHPPPAHPAGPSPPERKVKITENFYFTSNCAAQETEEK